jgi:hypothetical protein
MADDHECILTLMKKGNGRPPCTFGIVGILATVIHAKIVSGIST